MLLTAEFGFVNSDAPVVRRAEASDAADIAALQVRSWQRAYRGIVSDAFLDGLAEDAWLDRWTDFLLNAPEGVHQLVSSAGWDGPACAVAACGPAMQPTPAGTAQLYGPLRASRSGVTTQRMAVWRVGGLVGSLGVRRSGHVPLVRTRTGSTANASLPGLPDTSEAPVLPAPPPPDAPCSLQFLPFAEMYRDHVAAAVDPERIRAAVPAGWRVCLVP